MTKLPAHVRLRAGEPKQEPPSQPSAAERDLTEMVAALPHLPGVYRMLNGEGEVL